MVKEVIIETSLPVPMINILNGDTVTFSFMIFKTGDISHEKNCYKWSWSYWKAGVAPLLIRSPKKSPSLSTLT